MKERDLKSKASAEFVPSCTTIAVGKGATIDGSVIIAHSDDDVADERVIYVPACDPNEAYRAVYYDDASLGPRGYNSTELRRYIGKDRGPGYDTRDYPESKPLGQIPQVKHTYAYFDCSYGVMNEKQLMIGECTCGAKVHPEPEPGKRIFYSSELSRVALERCTTAREAIVLMAHLIEKYGLYGTGETLLIGDTDEAWFLEMCGYDENGKDGIWVAKRVPDNGFAVGANQFRIHDVEYNGSSTLEIVDFIKTGKQPSPNFEDSLGIEENPRILRTSSDTICSWNLFDVCKKKGWWDPSQGPLDWLKAVSWGEYFHPYYSLRRVWRALSKVAPKLNLPAWVEDGYTRAYPFSVVPEKKLSIADVMATYRDHYEGTEFDLTRGRAAGPFHDPTRYEENPDQGNSFNLNSYHPEGAWERPLSIYRCGMISVNQARGYLPDHVGGVCWIGLDRPAANCLMPFYVGVTDLPRMIQTMDLLKFDFPSNSEKDSAWWAFNFVANYATIKYSYMMEDLREKQFELEGAAYAAVSDPKKFFEKDPELISQLELTEFCDKNTKYVVSSWWKLAKALIVKYNDGYITTENAITKKAGYPKAWLCDAGYYGGPISYRKHKE